jgi:hypothetical protein
MSNAFSPIHVLLFTRCKCSNRPSKHDRQIAFEERGEVNLQSLSPRMHLWPQGTEGGREPTRRSQRDEHVGGRSLPLRERRRALATGGDERGGGERGRRHAGQAGTPAELSDAEDHVLLPSPSPGSSLRHAAIAGGLSFFFAAPQLDPAASEVNRLRRSSNRRRRSSNRCL